MYRKYSLENYDDLDTDRQRSIAEELDYNTAMEWGLLGKIRAKFPDLHSAICSREFGGVVTSKTAQALPKELYKSWDYLIENNLQSSLKEENYTLFAVIFEETFGKMPQQITGQYDATLAAQYKAARKGKPVTAGAGAIVAKAVKDSKFPEEIYMTWDELFKSGRHKSLKQNDITLYTVIYRETFPPKGKSERENPEGYDFVLANAYMKERERELLERMSKMTWDELVAAELTQKLRNLDWDLYCEKFETSYGKMPYE